MKALTEEQKIEKARKMSDLIRKCVKSIYNVHTYAYFRDDLKGCERHQRLDPLDILLSRPAAEWDCEIMIMFAQKPPQGDERMKKIARNPDPNVRLQQAIQKPIMRQESANRTNAIHKGTHHPQRIRQRQSHQQRQCFNIDVVVAMAATVEPQGQGQVPISSQRTR